MIACPACQTSNDDGMSFCTNCGKPLKAGAEPGDISGLMTADYTDASAPPFTSQTSSTADLEPSTVFAGRYTVVKKIGQGGMGVVYRATETLAGRDREIALKLIRADRITDQRSVDKLLSEGALTQDIRHPNVVGVYNVGDAGGQPFVAMEFVEGLSLREWLRQQVTSRKDVSPRVAGSIIRALLDGLEAAHKLGVVHRDLKPENVMLTGDPTAESAPLKILDFGIARAPGGNDSGTGTGLGTPRYMAPEQITNPDSVTPSADLYSLSVIFYELLMEVLPQGHWQPPSGGRADLGKAGPAFDKLIELGLSNRPGNRPQDVADYRAKLESTLRQLPDGGGPLPLLSDPAPSDTTQTLKKVGIGCAAVFGLLLLIGIIQSLVNPGGNPDPEPEVTRSAEPPINPPSSPAAPPSVPNFAAVSGDWTTVYQNSTATKFYVDVDSNGNFEGDDGLVGVSGNLASGNYSGWGSQGSLNGTIAWKDNGCHLQATLYYPNGAVYSVGNVHVDHKPGAACPSRFAPKGSN